MNSSETPTSDYTLTKQIIFWLLWLVGLAFALIFGYIALIAWGLLPWISWIAWPVATIIALFLLYSLKPYFTRSTSLANLTMRTVLVIVIPVGLFAAVIALVWIFEKP